VVLLETINPLDMTPPELWQLADLLTTSTDGVKFEVAYEDQHGAGVSWHEVLHLWLPSHEFLKNDAWAIVIGMVVENLRSRFKRAHNSKRPKTLIVHSTETGKELLHITIDTEQAELREEPPGELKRKVPPGRHRADG
jgi:hypothetical protein